MKAKIVWVREREWDEGESCDLPESEHKVVYDDPYDENYTKYVLIEVEDEDE